MLKPEILAIRPKKIAEAQRAISKLLAVLGTEDVEEALVLIRDKNSGGYVMDCDIPILRDTQYQMDNSHVQEVIRKAVEHLNGACKSPFRIRVERTYGEVVSKVFIEKGYISYSYDSPNGHDWDIVNVELRKKDDDESSYL